MFKTSKQELEDRLHRNELQRAQHPFSSERFVAAQQLIEAADATDSETISRQLAEKGLPSVEEVGRITAQNLLSWGRLHREATKLQQRLSRMSEGRM
jgi:hypothetical protein